MKCFFVYIASNRSHTLYIGITDDIVRRMREHRERLFPNGFTARYLFDRLVYVEPHATRKAAAEREAQLKGWTRARKVALIQAVNPNWLDLSLSYAEALRLQ